MAYLLPFINAFLLYTLTVEGQILNKYYTWFEENVIPRLPISSKVLGGCILCTSFWLGAIELPLVIHWKTAFFLLAYNAVLTQILFNQLKGHENS